jgi:dTDP-glucose 4,6-dehydratase
VTDHCAAIRTAIRRGQPGETYNVGGSSEKKNIDVVSTICTLLDELCTRDTGSYSELITFVNDRPGHDRRYAIDATKIQRELGWRPQHNFDQGIRETVRWYLEHMDWVENIRSGAYQQWIETNYAQRGAACGA